MMENNEELGKLQDYTGPQKLTPEIAENKEMGFALVGVVKKQFEDQKSPVLQLELQNDEKDYFLNLNRTNLEVFGDFMAKFDKVKIPEMIGMVFYFDKVKVRNPSTGNNQDSLIIDEVKDE